MTAFPGLTSTLFNVNRGKPGVFSGRKGQLAGGLTPYVATKNYNFLAGVPADFTFTRNSIGSYTDATGRIRYAAANEPRFDYNPDTLEIRGLLLEAAESNRAARSQEMNLWNIGSGTTVDANATLAPDLTLTADRINKDTTSFANINRTFTAGGASEHIFSVFVKEDNADTISLLLTGDNAATDMIRYNFTFSTETLADAGSTGTPTYTAVERYPNGWYRIAIGYTLPATSDPRGYIYPGVYNGTTAGSVFAWGAQIENNDIHSSYIPTAAAAVTREADLCQDTSADDYFNAAQGTVVVDFVMGGKIDSMAAFTFRHASADTNVRYRSSGSGATQFNVINAGSVQVNITGQTFVAYQRYRSAMRWKTNAADLSEDGVDRGTDTSVTPGSGISILEIGTRNGGDLRQSWARSLTYYSVFVADPYFDPFTASPDTFISAGGDDIITASGDTIEGAS